MMLMGEHLQKTQRKKPLLLMVSGGSDSIAMLEIACAWKRGASADDEFIAEFANEFGDPSSYEIRALHVNHLLRDADSDADEAFALMRCEELGVPCEVARIDVAEQARSAKGGLEAVARAERYRAADEALEHACAELGATEGVICTAHTLDDRVETFFMRALVGTGPGGLASIPRRRGKLHRPLLDASREQLRDWLRHARPDTPDAELWREDATNYSGENFRSQVRMELMPVLRALRPGFERSLAQTMDLIAGEDEALQQEADSLVYRILSWDGTEARIPAQALARASRPQARRILRSCLLVVKPDARLEAAQIDRVLDNLGADGYVTDVSGALRVRIDGDAVKVRVAGRGRGEGARP